MPTLDQIKVSEEGGTDSIQFAPFAEWEFPKKKIDESGSELGEKFSDDIRTIGYVVKEPRPDRVRKLQRLALSTTKANNFNSAWKKYIEYIDELILDWYDYGVEDEEKGEGTPWEEAKEAHIKWLMKDESLVNRWAEEYIERYYELEKKTDETLIDS